MQGKIIFINHNRGIYYVECSDNSYSVFELLDINNINEEDVIEGELGELGGYTLYNQTTGERFEAFIEDIGLSLQHLQTNLNNTSVKF